jgi:hypothetical protein
MTDPKWAVATERGRYYRDPAGGPDLPSITNVLGTGVNKSYALVPWGAGLVADAVIANPIETARRARTEPTALRKELAAIPRQNSERAANLGTRVHNRAQATVLGVPYPADPEVEPYARQLARWFRLWRVDLARDVEAVETTVMHRQLGYAGTGDLWVWLRSGRFGRRQLWLVDYKTSRHKPATTVYDDQPLQLAALRHAPEWLLPDDTTEPAPRVHRTALLNLRPRSHAFIPVPSGRAQFRAFRGALATTRYLHNAPTSFPAVVPPWAPGATERKAA